MKIFFLHVLTDGGLKRKLENARHEQRRTSSAMLEKFARDNCILTQYIKNHDKKWRKNKE